MIRFVAGLTLAAALAGATDRDMQRAIAWERHKDQAAARQAAKERRHPSVTYDRDRGANRSVDEDSNRNTVKDPGPPAYRDRKK